MKVHSVLALGVAIMSGAALAGSEDRVAESGGCPELRGRFANYGIERIRGRESSTSSRLSYWFWRDIESPRRGLLRDPEIVEVEFARRDADSAAYSIRFLRADGTEVLSTSYRFGSEWKCVNGALEASGERRQGGEGNIGTERWTQTLSRLPDGALLIRTDSVLQRRSIFTLGIPSTETSRIEDEYASAPRP